MQPTQTNWHNIRMIVLIALMFIIGGLQLIHGMTSFDASIDMILPVLIGLEHYLEGNSGTPTQ